METLIVITTVGDRETALKIARNLVEARLAACVNILAECTSVYRWQGKTEEAGEIPLLIKTRRETYAELEAAIRRLHPYELPEIVAVSVERGLPAYLQWVAAETTIEQNG
jgi:periplasmic divalent cation tolerance protein